MADEVQAVLSRAVLSLEDVAALQAREIAKLRAEAETVLITARGAGEKRARIESRFGELEREMLRNRAGVAQIKEMLLEALQ